MPRPPKRFLRGAAAASVEAKVEKSGLKCVHRSFEVCRDYYSSDVFSKSQNLGKETLQLLNLFRKEQKIPPFSEQDASDGFVVCGDCLSRARNLAVCDFKNQQTWTRDESREVKFLRVAKELKSLGLSDRYSSILSLVW
eukprot:Lithocolla_globosa_v1_NODE_5827_length_1179_cov_4.130783.p1 type:complete len:139 gc:universal NODE_5827_length_1179_cov_4.130783:825-409(-)